MVLLSKEQKATADTLSYLHELIAMNFGAGVSFEFVRMFFAIASEVNTTSDLHHKRGYSVAAVNRHVTKMTNRGFITLNKMEGTKAREIALTAKGLQVLDGARVVLSGGAVPRLSALQEKYIKGQQDT